MFHKSVNQIRKEAAKLYEEITFNDRVCSYNTMDRQEIDPWSRDCIEDDGYDYTYDLIGAKKRNSFEGKCYFLSTFYLCAIEIGGALYPSAEHAYQALKCKYARDAKRFACGGDLGKKTPLEAKIVGNRLIIRDGWNDEMAKHVMYGVNKAKFDQDDELYRKLRKTRGIDICNSNSYGDRRFGKVDGVGKNILGIVLTAIRDEIPYDDDFVYGEWLTWDNFVHRKYIDRYDPEYTEEDYTIGCMDYNVRVVEVALGF